MKWLDRRISAPGPYLCLCLSEAEYFKAFKRLKLKPTAAWVSQRANATAHFAESADGVCAVVCIDGFEGRSGIEVAGLLVHEAVHIWQEWCDYYGEARPGHEQEAYAIQAIAQELMAEYARRTGAGN